MKIQIKQQTHVSQPGISAVHVLEITPCNLPHVARKPEIQNQIALQILEWLFRQFNRVDGSEFITLFNLHMPSLSVGDTVELEGFGTWRCEPTGWVQL